MTAQPPTPPRTALEALRDALGLRRSMVGLLAMAMLVAVGERLAERFLPDYLMTLGGGALAVGLLAGLDNLLSALYRYPGGYLSDRIGPKRSLLVFNLIAIAGFLIVILVPAWPAVIGAAFLFLSWTAVSMPASMDLVARSLPQSRRTMGVTMLSFVRRVPKAVGPVIGGACIDTWGMQTGIRVAFGVALAMAVLALVMQQVLIEDDRGTRGQVADNPVEVARDLLRTMPPALRDLLIADVLVRACEQIPNAFVVIWCLRRIADPVSATDFGLLTAIEMATAMLIYIPVAYLADRTHKKPFIVITFAFFALFPAVLWFCHSFWPLVIAFIVRGLKEFGEPTRKALIMDLAPEGRKAATFGLYYLLRDSVTTIAALGGAWLWVQGPGVTLATAFAFGVFGTAWFAWRGRDLNTPPAAATPRETPPGALHPAA